MYYQELIVATKGNKALDGKGVPMRRPTMRFSVAVAVLLAFFTASASFAPAPAGEITSRMRTVSGVFESNGYRIAPVYDVDIPSDYEDLTTPQAYEILRPDTGQPLSIGRLFTSCSCIRLEAPKRTFEPGERVILYLRNIRATPANGQMYAFFVQLTAPMQSTLRFDTFVQTGVRIGEERPPQSATPSEDEVAASLELPEPVGSGTSAPTTTSLNNQLAAALRAVNGHADETLPAEIGDGTVEGALEGTGDILDAAAGAADDAGEAAETEAAAETAAPAESAEPASPADAAESASPSPAPLTLSTDLGGDLPAFDAAPGTDAAALNDDQILQLQRLALIQAEEQAKQLASRVQQLQTPSASTPAGANEAAPATAPAASPPSRRAPPPLAGRPVQSVSLITIGVRDMPASIRFYEALGWQRAARGKYDQTAFFQLNGQVLALYPLADLLLEQNMKDAVPAPGGITLALHVQAKEDVAAVYRLFVEAGGKSLRPPAEMASGAVSSYVADPDGNPWEISWVPQFTLDPNGGLWLP